MTKADQFAATFSRHLFTGRSLALHLVAFTIAWQAEGGDHHLFLDAISVEAVLVTLLVGMATKRGELQREHLEAVDRERLELDLRLDQATHERLVGHDAKLRNIADVSHDIHKLAAQIHKHLNHDQQH
jgi:hypothetical protein